MLKYLKIESSADGHLLLGVYSATTKILCISDNGLISFTEKDFLQDTDNECKTLSKTIRKKVTKEKASKWLTMAEKNFIDKIDETFASMQMIYDAAPDIIIMKYADGTVKKGCLKKLNYEYDDVLNFYGEIEDIIDISITF